MADLSVDLAPSHEKGLHLTNPVMTASGTCGYGPELQKLFDIELLGGIVTKTVTLNPRRGNPAQRIDETSAGMLNSIGLQGIGISALLRDFAPLYATWGVKVIISIMEFITHGYADVAHIIEGEEGIAGIELNLSCPNTERGGIEFGQEPVAAAEVVKRVVSVTSLPIIAKLTPNVSDPRIVAEAVVRAGAHALCAGNTLVGMTMSLERRRPVIATTFAGLSGPAIKPVMLRQVYQIAGAVDVPVIGCGGISNARDALEFILAGATAVQIGTASFANPLASVQTVAGIEAYCKKHGVEDIMELVGCGRASSAPMLRQPVRIGR